MEKMEKNDLKILGYKISKKKQNKYFDTYECFRDLEQAQTGGIDSFLNDKRENFEANE